MIPSKKDLVELYVDKRLTTYEIAEIYSVARRTVGRWFKKYNIDANPKQRKYELIKKIPFTKEQKEFVVGTVLGDGCIALHGRKNKSCRLMIGHCKKQKDLVMWKKAILGNFVNVVSKRIDKRQNSIMYNFNTVTHNDLNAFRKLFYENNKKVIRPEIVNYLSPLALAVWVMDDGSKCSNYNIRISTDSFTKKENELLQSMIKARFGLRCKVCEYNRNNKKYYYLSFNKRNSILLTGIIDKFVIDCMKYKLVNQPSTTER